MHINKVASSLIGSLFKDKNDRIVIMQFPNIPIIGWFVCLALAKLISSGHLRTSLELISAAFLFTWAYLEIFQGVNYFRRILGVIVVIAAIVSLIRH
jgi:hypothetical protein